MSNSVVLYPSCLFDTRPLKQKTFINLDVWNKNGSGEYLSKKKKKKVYVIRFLVNRYGNSPRTGQHVMSAATKIQRIRGWYQKILLQKKFVFIKKRIVMATKYIHTTAICRLFFYTRVSYITAEREIRVCNAVVDTQGSTRVIRSCPS
jgi:hypothetical protein